MPSILHTYSTIEELTKLTASIVSTMKLKTKKYGCSKSQSMQP